MMNCVISGDAPDMLEWFYLRTLLDTAGNSTCQEFLASGGDNVCGARNWSTWTLAADGVVRITPNPPSFHGVLNLSDNIINLTLTDGGGGYDLCSMVKMGGVTFNVSDLQGTWMMHILTTGDAPSWLGSSYMKMQLDNAGNSTCQEYLNSGGDNSCAGKDWATWAVSADGVVTLSSNASLHGAMSADKNFIALTITDGGGGYDLAILVKTGGAFTTADAQGTWMTHVLGSDETDSGNNGWAYMKHVVNATGTWTCLQFLGADGDSRANLRNFAGITISADGIVHDFPNGTGHGIMSLDKNLIVFTAKDNGGAGPGVLLGISSRM